MVTGALHQTIAFYKIPKQMSFSPDGPYLITNVGVRHVQSQCDDSTPSLRKRKGEILIDNAHWIRVNNERALYGFRSSSDPRVLCSTGAEVLWGTTLGRFLLSDFRLGNKTKNRKRK